MVTLRVLEVEVDGAEPEVDGGFWRELLRRYGERAKRRQHQRLGIGIECQNATWLDQSPRHRLDENSLRQIEHRRCAAAYVASLVACHQRHCHLGAGPGMLRKIARGLGHAVARARLRQGEREFGPVE